MEISHIATGAGGGPAAAGLDRDEGAAQRPAAGGTDVSRRSFHGALW